MIEAYEAYSPLDSLGRCGVASACLGPETLAPEGGKRGEISHIQPSGWQLTCYHQRLVPGESLFNRTHLIARCLCERADVPENLITGTQHLNQTSMQPLENRVVEYIRQSGNHVLYRVTPSFEGTELVARKLRVEARSLEDDGAGISINMVCRNVQPGVSIDYATGRSKQVGGRGKGTLSMKGYLLGDPLAAAPTAGMPANADALQHEGASPVLALRTAEAAVLPADDDTSVLQTLEAPYVLNYTTQRFHLQSCKFVNQIAAQNEGFTRLSREMLQALDYAPCGHCNP